MFILINLQYRQMSSKNKTHHRYLFVILLASLLIINTKAFTFKELAVSASTYVTNQTATYTVTYITSSTNEGIPTVWNTTFYSASSSVVLNFPVEYDLSKSTTIICSYSINGTDTFTVGACSVLGNVITLTNIFNNTIVQNFSLMVSGIVNPFPAQTTSDFAGSIGGNTAEAYGINSFVTITYATTSSCSYTFTPNFVYQNPANMIITFTTINQLPQNGYIVVNLPNRWSQDLNASRPIPVTNTTMVCNNYSSNINSALQCTGSTNTQSVTIRNVVGSTLNGSSTISFSINSLNTPPTNQPIDAITVTTYTQSDLAIDYCDKGFVYGLLPRVIPSSQFLISEVNNSPMIVNQQYTIRFNITTVVPMSQSDNVVIVFPTGTTISNINNATASSTIAINRTTFIDPNLTIFFSGTTTLNSSRNIYMAITNFVAPPSTAPTDNFVLYVMSRGYPRMTASQSLTAVVGSLSGSVVLSNYTVNQPSTYTFTITTNNALTPAGQIKIFFPRVLTITSSSSCASISGSFIYAFPNCSYMASQNSITFRGLNISATTTTNIPAQSFNLTVSGITNPPSTLQTSSFIVTTYYNAISNALVDNGTIAGFNPAKATITSSQVRISSSSVRNSDTAVSYYISCVLNNRIVSGGSILVYFPSTVVFTVSAVPTACQVGFNSSATTTTSCTVTFNTTFYVFTFTNPFQSTNGEVGTNVTLAILGSATNPPTTVPFGPFSIYTRYNDGTDVAAMQNVMTYSTSIPSAFDFNQFNRNSNKNADITTYSISLKQKATLEQNAKVVVTFPSATQVQNNSTCSINYNGATTNLSCTASGNVLTMTTPNFVINAGDIFTLIFTNIRNPLSTANLTNIVTTTYTSTGLYNYSSGATTNNMSNTETTSFRNISYTYSPRQLNQSINLQVYFTFSQFTLMPSYLYISIDPYFTIGTLACTSFANNFTTWSLISEKTLKITGPFNSSVVGIGISGFSSPTVAPSTPTFTTITSFDSDNGKIDVSLTDISFNLACTMPCMTCDSTNTSSCLSCYNSTSITPSIYFYSTGKQCYTLCPDTTYNNLTTLTCQPCSSNCLNCMNTPHNCTKCFGPSSYPYLNISGTSQECVSSCSSGMYPQTAISPVTCKKCIIPCATCLTDSTCLTCTTGYYMLGNSTCSTSCPANTTVANNLTNTCDACASICLRCVGSTTNCIACTAPKVFYNGSCADSCPPGGDLAPDSGVCAPCNVICLTCSGTITNCTTCNISSGYPYFVNNSCLASCPIQYYNVSSTGQCISCASANINCINCSSVSTCLSCDAYFIYFAPNKSCLSSAPDGYVNISGIATLCNSNCATCSVTTINCTSCTTGSLQNNKCVSSCSSGTISVSNVCVACSSPCATCSINQTNCDSCLSPLTPQVFLWNHLCQQNCPSFTYANNSNYQCSACVSPCVLCTSLTSCSSCILGKYLFNSSCISPCPTGYVGITGVCQICTQNCKTCSGAPNSCVTCVNNTYLLNSSSSCVTNCGDGLFIDYVKQLCVGCSGQCETCVNASNVCLTCKSGYVFFNNQCLTNCPVEMFAQANTTCMPCSKNCSDCTSLTNCSKCSGLTYLYNYACTEKCPSAYAVIVDGACTVCSTQFCATCNGADVCLTCKSGYLYLNAVCLTGCTQGYSSNGTHCIAKLTEALTESATIFPVPFSIAGAVLLIACLMSRLQFNQTYLSGAVFAFIGVLQVLALVYFLYLYLVGYYSTESIPFYIGAGALGYLFVLNIIACLAQSIFLCYEKQFQTWRTQSGFHKCFYGLISILSLIISHKIRNILFCKLFTFKIFSAKLEKVDNFRIFNIFSLLSIVHSGGAIFAAAVALKYIDAKEQVFYQCVDVIVLTSLNAVLAFFNSHKDKNFFEEVTPEGFSLHKKNQLDQDYYPDKLQVHGNDGEIQEGFMNDYNHALVSKAALKFDQASLNQLYSENSMANINNSDKDNEKEYEQISVQALGLIDQKVNMTAKTGAVKSDYKPVFEEISIQVQQIIAEEKKDVGIDLSQLPPQGFQNDSSNFTSYNYFKKVDCSAQSTLNRPVNHSAQVDFKLVDQSIQKYDNYEYNDISIQKDPNISKVDYSIQNDMARLAQNDVSIQPSIGYQDMSISMSRREKSFGIQQKATLSDKDVSAIVSMKNRSNQLSVISQEDEEIKMGAQMIEQGIQPTVQYNQIAVQPTLDLEQEAVHPEYNEMAIQYEPGDEVAFNQFQEELDHTNTASNMIYDIQEAVVETKEQQNLREEKAEELELQVDQIKSYQEELEERIRQREKELNQVKRKIMMKERINEKKRQQLEHPQFQQPPVRIQAIRFVEQPKKEKNNNYVKEKSVGNESYVSDSKKNQPIQQKPSLMTKVQTKDINLQLQSKQIRKQIQPVNQRQKTITSQGLAQDTIEEIKVDKREQTDKQSSRQKTIQEIRQKTIEEIKRKQVVKQVGRRRNYAPKEQIKNYDQIEYKQYEDELASHEDSEQHQNELEGRIQDLTYHERQEREERELKDEIKKQHETINLPQKQEDEVQSNSNRQSELTRKNFITSNKKDVVVDVVEIDRDLSGEEDLELQQANESEPEPTGINQFRQTKKRERSPNSSLQGTIQQIPRHYTKIDNDKTVGNNSFVQAQAAQKKYAVTSRIEKEDVVNYFNNNIAVDNKMKGRQLPKEADIGEKYHINKLYSREQINKNKTNVAQNKSRNGQGEQANTLAMAGRAQFTEDIVKRKQREIKNPLHTQKNWQARNQQKYISDQDNHIVQEPNRKNLVRNNNKNLQNFASHLVLPQQSDKQQTTFQKAARKVERQEKSISQKRKDERWKKQDPREIQVNFEADQFSQELQIGGNIVPEIPRTNNNRKPTSNAARSLYNDEEEVDYRGMMILGQMQQRPKNADLDEYYKRKNSKQKRRSSNARLDKSTQKIYMQRLDRKK